MHLDLCAQLIWFPLTHSHIEAIRGSSPGPQPLPLPILLPFSVLTPLWEEHNELPGKDHSKSDIIQPLSAAGAEGPGALGLPTGGRLANTMWALLVAPQIHYLSDIQI